MSKRPSRAKMCSWLSGELFSLRVMPVNPADIETLARNARTADRKLRRLASIASELGWNVDADLDTAATLIREYEGHFLADTDEPKDSITFNTNNLGPATDIDGNPLADTDEGSSK